MRLDESAPWAGDAVQRLRWSLLEDIKNADPSVVNIIYAMYAEAGSGRQYSAVIPEGGHFSFQLKSGVSKRSRTYIHDALVDLEGGPLLKIEKPAALVVVIDIVADTIQIHSFRGRAATVFRKNPLKVAQILEKRFRTR